MTGRRWRPTALAVAAAVVALPATGAAWLVSGHHRMSFDAVGALPIEMPDSFRGGAAVVAHAAVDPDLWRNHGTPALADREAPEHYINLELLHGEPLPERREEYEKLLGRLEAEPGRVGALPYAILEGAERLALCFAEHRRWPTDETIRSKCLLQAGWLAHFAGDLIQPLHTTVHHDGHALPDGASPHSGIHRRVDGLFGRSFEIDLDAERTELRSIADLFAAVRVELAASHALVGAVYGLESAMQNEKYWSDPRVVAFATERYRAGARFIAELFWWSWRRSAEIELPEWLER